MAALWTYLAVDALLLLSTLFLPPLASWAVRVAVVALGAVALAVGVRWQRPHVRVGWWLIVCFSAVNAAADVAAIVRFAATGVVSTGVWLPALVPAVSYPLLIAGLALLARLSGPADAADTLDALMIALATFLVLFALVIHPVLIVGWAAVVAAIIFPLSLLLMLAMLVKVVFSIGVPTISVGVLLLAQICHFAAATSVIVSELTSTGLGHNLGIGSLEVSSPALWTASYVLLGAAGLHPSLGRIRYWPA